MQDWRELVRDVPGFPSEGVVFKDITPVLADAEGFNGAVEAMAAPWRGVVLDAVFAIESRGFILGAAMARALGLPMRSRRARACCWSTTSWPPAAPSPPRWRWHARRVRMSWARAC